MFSAFISFLVVFEGKSDLCAALNYLQFAAEGSFGAFCNPKGQEVSKQRGC